MGGQSSNMGVKKALPSRQAKGNAQQKSNQIVSRGHSVWEWSMVALGMFVLFGLPRLMYLVIAPMKGWA